MSSKINLDPNRLYVFHEGKKRRIFVGELSYNPQKDYYQFIYDQKYVHYKNAIPIGPEFSLFRSKVISKGKLFPSFLDRIPDKSNPAYKDYCKAVGISPTEKNPIILLGTIGKRGPSSFVFEQVYTTDFNASDIINLRKQLMITQNDLAEALGIKKVTLQKIEKQESTDPNTLKLLQIYFEFPEVASWQLKQTGGKVNSEALVKLLLHFYSKNKEY